MLFKKSGKNIRNLHILQIWKFGQLEDLYSAKVHKLCGYGNPEDILVGEKPVTFF